MIAGGYLKNEAPSALLPGPNVTTLSDSTTDGVRRLRIRATSARQAPIIFLYVFADSPVLNPAVNNKPIIKEVGKVWVVQYFAVPQEGVEMAFDVKSASPIKIRAVDMSYGLPRFSNMQIKPRPDHLIPGSILYTDLTLVNKSFAF
jgi:hypothetical protein